MNKVSNFLLNSGSKGLSLRSLQNLSLLPHASPSSGSRHFRHSDELVKTPPQVNAQVGGRRTMNKATK